MTETFEDRVDERMDMFSDALSLMAEGAKKELVKDALYDYCRICVQLDDVNEDVRATGTTIKNTNGNTVRNPDLMTQHQLLNEKNALLPKLLKALPDGEVKDALAAFSMA